MQRRHRHTHADEHAHNRSTAGRAARWLAALAGGAVVQYVLDPAAGRSRRARLADRVRRPTRKATDRAGKKLQVVADKSVGTVRGAVTGSEPPPNDQALADKIRSEVLGTGDFRDHTILVDSADGNVTLRGHVAHPDQVKALERAVARIEGVGEVTNLVHLRGTDPANTREPLEASHEGSDQGPS